MVWAEAMRLFTGIRYYWLESLLVAAILLLFVQLVPARTWQMLKPVRVGLQVEEVASLATTIGATPTEVNLDFLLYLPSDYRHQDKWPLLISLHGSGQCGNSLGPVKKTGPARLVNEGQHLPFIVASPLCKSDQNWDPHLLKTFIEYLCSIYKVDRSRIYCTGLSMGGSGTWDLAVNYPDLLAAIAPICGTANVALAPKIKNVPVWVFHGSKDNVVNVESSEHMVAALNKCGGDAKLKIYPDAGHDAWTRTYNNPQLYKWLLSHTKK